MKRQNLRRWLVVLATVAIGVCLTRSWLLKKVAEVLVVDQSADDCDYVLASLSNCCLDEAARWYHENPRRHILVISGEPSPPVKIGVVPSNEAICRKELCARGIPVDAIEVVPGKARDAWSAARLLAEWSAARPGSRIVVLCNRFNSRSQRVLFDAVFPRGKQDQVAVSAVRHAWFDEGNWWRSSPGIKNVMFSYLDLAFVACKGEPEPLPPILSPDH